MGFFDAVPYPIRVTISEGAGQASVWDRVGLNEYPGPDGTPYLTASVLLMYAVECNGQIAGLNPVYSCFQFAEDYLSGESEGDPGGVQYEFQAFALSLQTDGSVYYTYQVGLHAVGIGYLRRTTESSSLDAIGRKEEDEGRNLDTGMLQELCSSETMKACVPGASLCGRVPFIHFGGLRSGPSP
jgi:hypothetical protein